MHHLMHTKVFKESEIQFSPNVLCLYLLHLIIFVLGETENKGTKIVMLYGPNVNIKRKIREAEYITREESTSHITKKMTRKQVFVTEVSEGIISSKTQNFRGGKKNLRKLIEFS